MPSVTPLETDGEVWRFGNRERVLDALIFYDASANRLVIAAPGTVNCVTGGVGFDIGSSRTFTIDACGLGSFNAGLILNEDGGDFDFRVESNCELAMLFVDGGNNQVGVGGPLGPATDARLFVVDDGAGAIGHMVDYWHESGSPVDDDAMHFGYWAEDSGDNAVEIARMRVVTIDTACGSKGASVNWDVMIGNSLVADVFAIGEDVCDVAETRFNEAGGDVNLRAESCGETHMLFLDGGNNQLIVGGAAGPTTSARLVAIDDAVGATGRPFDLYHNPSDGSAAANDVMEIGYWGTETGATARELVRQTVKSIDISDGDMDAHWALDVMKAGTLINDLIIAGVLTANGVLSVIINEDGDDVDTRIEGLNNANLLTLDGGTDTVAFGSAVVTGAFLTLTASAQNRAAVTCVGAVVNIPAEAFDHLNGGNEAVVASVFIGIPTWISTGGAATFTTLASLHIQGPPVASTCVTGSTIFAVLLEAGDLGLSAGNLRLGPVNAFSCEPTQTLVMEAGTPPAGAIVTSGALFSTATVIQKLIAAGTVNNVET